MRKNKEKWLEIFKAWETSGLTRTEFCKTQKLKVSTFDYWRRAIRKNGGSEETLVKLSHVVTPPASNSIISMELSGGYKLTIPSGYNSDHLKRLLTDIRSSL